MLFLIKVFSVFLYLFATAETLCAPSWFNSDSFVCVCNSTDCDFLGTISTPDDGFFTVLTSSKDEFRFNLQTLPMELSTDNAVLRIFVNASETRQTMFGFGGAFTDATGINIDSLSNDLQDILIKQYFSTDGIEYNVGRIPIGGCDFSTHPYSYDDVDGDETLLFFNLAPEDYQYKLPYITRAIEVSGRDLLLFGSPWSPPSWMKVSGMFNGTGGLKPGMQQPWANYFVKFIEAYIAEGAPIWGITAQNEPTNGLYNSNRFNECGFTPEGQRDFVRDFLGPTLVATGFDNVIVMVTDDNRNNFPEYPVTVLNDTEAAAFIHGVAVHWYEDRSTPSSKLDNVHNLFPDKFIMYTEACAGYEAPPTERVLLGSWTRAEYYVEDILENVNHWSTGWVDWNMALNMEGGPNWVSNFVDSPIIVNADSNEFYRQPMFYALGHFSKLIPEGSIALRTSVVATSEMERFNQAPGAEGVRAAAFLNPSGNVVIVAINRFNYDQLILIEDSVGHSTNFIIPYRSFNTITYAL